VLGLFAAMWLNMALQPCAMAMQMAHDHGCSHCPPSQVRDAAESHHGDGHHAEQSVSPCAQADTSCAAGDEPVVDARKVQLKLKSSQADLPVAIASYDVCSLGWRPDETLPPLSTLPARAVPFPPLHVLFCIYLD